MNGCFIAHAMVRENNPVRLNKLHYHIPIMLSFKGCFLYAYIHPLFFILYLLPLGKKFMLSLSLFRTIIFKSHTIWILSTTEIYMKEEGEVKCGEK